MIIFWWDIFFNVSVKSDLVMVDVTVTSDDNPLLNPRLWQATLQCLEKI